MSFIKSLIIGFTAVTVVFFIRDFFWPWLHEEYILWSNSVRLRRLVKKINKSQKTELADLTRKLEELAALYDRQRANNKL